MRLNVSHLYYKDFNINNLSQKIEILKGFNY